MAVSGLKVGKFALPILTLMPIMDTYWRVEEAISMSLSDMFERLGAPLANNRWSWGAIRPDGTVFVRVWSDETEQVDGARYVRLINRAAYQDVDDNLGFAERCAHVEMLANGADGYAIMCTAREPRARSREIVSYDRRSLIRLGPILTIDGDEWAAMAERVPLAAA